MPPRFPVPVIPDVLPPKLVRMSVIAEAYDLSERTIRAWVAAGKLTGYRIGDRSLRLDPDEVRSMIVKRVPSARASL